MLLMTCVMIHYESREISWDYVVNRVSNVILFVTNDFNDTEQLCDKAELFIVIRFADATFVSYAFVLFFGRYWLRYPNLCASVGIRIQPPDSPCCGLRKLSPRWSSRKRKPLCLLRNEERRNSRQKITSSQPASPQEGNSIHSSFMRKSVIRNIVCARNARGCVVDPHTGHYVCFVSFCGWRHYYVTSACERQTSRRLVCFILRL